ncbi:BglG family transcription antiterminator [[Clostridium] innocuum]|nr:BglG family transcription antiterminator [[Clostridium] innocuum]MCR0578538.1 BglG family transcription antiterminator [[Clostridium] innocuum]
MLSERERKLLKILFESSDSLTTEKLAFHLAVTSRTVKSDMKSINLKLAEHNIRIQAKQGKGIWLDVPIEEEHWMYEQLYAGDNRENQTKNLRKYEITNYLLDFNSYISIEDICEHLYYSRSSITKELFEVEMLLSKYGLKLLRNNLGIYVDGNEKDIRITKIMLNEKLNMTSDLREISKQRVFEGIDITGLYDILLLIESRYAIQFNDAELRDIFFYLAVMIKRHKAHLNRRKLIKVSESAGDDLYQISSAIMEEVCLRFDLEYTSEELLYFYWFISGFSVLQDSIIVNAVTYEHDEIYGILQKILLEIDGIYHTDFSSNNTLLKNLFHHLIPAINRSKYHIFIENPLLAELKRTFAYAFEISLLIAGKLEEHLQICLLDNEIGLFTMHIAAALENKDQPTKTYRVAIVCTTGKGISEFLKARIQSVFREIKIVSILTSSRIDNESVLEQLDFIISTTALKPLDIPVIYVAPVLKEKDIERIHELLIKLQQKEQYKMNTLYQLLDTKISSFQITAGDKNTLLCTLCDNLITEGYGNSHLYESLLRREAVSGTAIGNLIAIPHPFPEEILKSGISIAVLKKPILWDGEKVQLVFLLCISTADNKNLEYIMEDIFEIAQNTELVMKLINTRDLHSFIECIELAHIS